MFTKDSSTDAYVKSCQGTKVGEFYEDQRLFDVVSRSFEPAPRGG